MNNPKIVVAAAVNVMVATCLCSCTSPQGDKLLSNDQSRFTQQSKRLPDRESTEQEKAYQEAQRKADMNKK
ncbi:MAG TPA: hypothetical protein PKD68_05485 [Candidatus Saccharibacteria bacterium]|nr:hypothetical protein [Candidatus Saccharibacteria bacterium]